MQGRWTYLNADESLFCRCQEICQEICLNATLTLTLALALALSLTSSAGTRRSA